MATFSLEVYSTRRDPIHTARSSACRALEKCRGSTVVMLLMYRRKSVGKMTPPSGTPRIFTLVLDHPGLFLLICRVGSIRSICTFFQKRRSQVSAAGDLHARLYQKPLPGQIKRKDLFIFLKGILYLLGNEGQLIFCAPDIQSVLVTVVSVLPEMISIFS